MDVRRNTRGLALAATLAGVVLALTPAPQAAAWDTVFRQHGGRLEVCRTPVIVGFVVKARLVNTNARHVHLGNLGRARGSEVRRFRVAAGAVSPVKSVRARSGDDIGLGFRERNGTGAGDTYQLREIGRCRAIAD